MLKADPAVAISGWAREYQRDGKVAAARSLLERAAKTYPDNEVIARERALLLYTVKDCRGAIDALARFEAATSDVQTVNDLALFQTCLGDRDAVIRLLERSLALKPDQPGVAQALAQGAGGLSVGTPSIGKEKAGNPKAPGLSEPAEIAA